MHNGSARQEGAPVARVGGLETLLGTVRVTRDGLGARGRETLFPLDAKLNLQAERYSFGIRRRAAAEATSADTRDAEGHGAKSEAVRERAILALLRETSIGAAAQRCGVNERTLRRWLNDDPAIATAYDQARHATVTAGISRIQALTTKAVDTPEDVLDATNHPAVRLGAARSIIDFGLHERDAASILRRREDVERATRELSS